MSPKEFVDGFIEIYLKKVANFESRLSVLAGTIALIGILVSVAALFPKKAETPEGLNKVLTEIQKRQNLQPSLVLGPSQVVEIIEPEVKRLQSPHEDNRIRPIVILALIDLALVGAITAVYVEIKELSTNHARFLALKIALRNKNRPTLHKLLKQIKEDELPAWMGITVLILRIPFCCKNPAITTVNHLLAQHTFTYLNEAQSHPKRERSG